MVLHRDVVTTGGCPLQLVPLALLPDCGAQIMVILVYQKLLMLTNICRSHLKM